MLILIGLLVLLVAVVGGVAYAALRNKQAFARQNEIVAGTPSRAPAAWAGSHSPEALLHRRLRAAVDGARAQIAGPASGLDDVVAAIERGANEIDDRLIAAAALPAPHRSPAIAELEPSVESLEAAVAGIHAGSTEEASGGSPAIGSALSPAVAAALSEAHERLEALAQARSEVDGLDTSRVRTDPSASLTEPTAGEPRSTPPTPPPTG